MLRLVKNTQFYFLFACLLVSLPTIIQLKYKYMDKTKQHKTYSTHQTSEILTKKTKLHKIQDLLGEARGGQAPPIDMLGPPNQQVYSFEDSGFCA